ncbi:DUF4269 domain-containing protein [Empedobacter sedimenti]|uniref:DUF4269 domain-containing protein n=1 Tax=Empedobacter sedimenti TaxID=3042610 RepID=UPI0024A63492|nr:DUF4269 domain-containing protein [Empedobacter sedimenti]
MQNFLTIDYLEHGNEVQQNVFHLLSNYQILEKLDRYKPIVVGTIPIEINIENSDIDIIGETSNFEGAKNYLIENFSHYLEFKINLLTSNNEICLTCNFRIDAFEIEIYLQNKIPTEQNAYRHILIEAKLLEKFDESFKNKIIELKKNGYKTEPAFAKLLELKGNPYLTLLEYKVD